MRRVLVSALMLAVVAGCASSRSPRRAGVVPWVNRPLPLYRTPAPKLIPYSASAPRCRPGQLRITEGQGGAATGNDSEPLLFTNIAARPCLLRGYPTVSAETPAGARRTLHPHHGTFFGPYVQANLAPGRHVLLDFGTSTGCEGGDHPVVRYTGLVFGLPRGGTVAAPASVSISAQCGLDMSAFGLPARYGPLRAPRGTPGTLHASVRLPRKIRAGITGLDFVVTLSNPTATRVRLRPCPGYTEALYTGGLSVHASFSLDCDAVDVIPAHGRARFAMRLRLPSPLPSERVAKLGWSLDTPTGPSTGRGLLITPK